MKAKVFITGSPEELERELNGWFKANPRVQIEKALQSESGDAEGFSITVTLLYSGSEGEETPQEIIETALNAVPLPTDSPEPAAEQGQMSSGARQEHL